MRSVLLALVVALAIVSSQASAMEFAVHPNAASMPNVAAILATGEVEEGDTDRLAALILSLPAKPTRAIYLASPGGSLFEGMRLGRLFKMARIKTVVEGGQVCASGRIPTLGALA